MTVTQQIMRRMNFPLTYLGTKALCPLLYSSHHPILCSHVRWYKRPGASSEKIPFWKYLNPKYAAQTVKSNVNLMFQEIKNNFKGPGGKPLKQTLEEQTTVLWKFRGPEDLQSWVVSTDQEMGGKSQAFLKLGKNNQTALFSGVLNSEVPRDGETAISGYCSLRSRPVKGAFGRILHSDWSNFNILHLRIRGDGRPWIVNIQSDTYFSLQWDDLYHYFIYTRGGPYWQDVKIPLSKFFMSSRGRIQDGQYPLLPDKVITLGLTLADKADGPFQLEIDFIGLAIDQSHTEEFAYELYRNIPM